MGIWDTVQDSFREFEAASIIDIIAIAVLIYLVLLLLKGTVAITLVRGIVIMIVGLFVLARVLDLTVVDWLLRNSFPALIIAIPVIFQAEIRRFLERVGRTGAWPWAGPGTLESVVDMIAEAVTSMSERRHGAIIVIERETGLEDYIGTGVRLDAECSTQLLQNIFFPNSALHDGAVVIRESRVVAASCTLPLSDRSDASYSGTRHRAALGVTERTDAVAVVVSEETGHLSIAANARMITNLDGPRLRGILRSLLLPASEMDRPRGPSLPRLSRG
ncbi:MAG: diadenylate cyclase CdaA [Dehalococcoidia bacterium]